MLYTTLGQFQLTPAWILWTLLAYFVLPCMVYLTVPFLIRRSRPATPRNISIFVLGDLGHSPRMCYHALSFSRLGYAVNLCGYLETEPPATILDDPNVDIIPIRVVHNTRKLPYLLFAMVKILRQIGQLWHILGQVPGCLHIMLQNPPALPLLAILLVYIRVCSPHTKLIIDWHNLNYLILNLRYRNEKNLVVRLMRLYESRLGQLAWCHITVTSAMKDFLVEQFGFTETAVHVLRDRPGPQFKPLSEDAKKDILKHDVFADIDMNNRRILVSSTSFTPDEDFNSLVDSLQAYEVSKAPPLLVLVTGKGPMKADFLENVARCGMRKVVVRSAWLSAEEYPLVLSAADLAVSLHTSLSGLDLPMKILDFFGVGVPVVTLDFAAIGELVSDGENGLVVKKAELHLAIIDALLNDLLLHKLKDGALRESEDRWDKNWSAVLEPIFAA